MTPVHESIRDLDRGAAAANQSSAMACSDRIVEPTVMDDPVPGGSVDVSARLLACSSLQENTYATADALIAYADGVPVDAKLRMALDDLIVDYAEGVLGPEAVHNLEACMRRSSNLVRLVADKIAEFHLLVRFSMFHDGLLDPESSAELKRLIENDPDAARVSSDMRIGGDLCRLMAQPIQDEIPALAGDSLKAPRAILADENLLFLSFAELIDWANGSPVDTRAEAAFEHLVSAYVAGCLDEHAAKGLETAMGLSNSAARLVADHAERQRP